MIRKLLAIVCLLGLWQTAHALEPGVDMSNYEANSAESSPLIDVNMYRSDFHGNKHEFRPGPVGRSDFHWGYDRRVWHAPVAWRVPVAPFWWGLAGLTVATAIAFDASVVPGYWQCSAVGYYSVPGYAPATYAYAA